MRENSHQQSAPIEPTPRREWRRGHVSLRAGLAVVALTALATGLALPLAAQQAGEKVDKQVSRAISSAKKSNPGISVRIDPATGLPTSIRGLSPNVSLGAAQSSRALPTDEAAKKVAEAFFASSELSAAFPTKNAAAKVEAMKVRPDPDVRGQRIVQVEQRVNGVRVFGSTGKVIVSPSLAVTQLTASLSTVAIDSTAPSIEKTQAIDVGRKRLREVLEERKRDRSLDRLRSALDSVSATADVVVFDPALMRSRGATSGPARLSWLVSIDAFRLFVDAKTAEVVFFYRDQPTAGLRQVYDLGATTSFPGKRLIDDVSKQRTEPLPKDAELAYSNTGSVGAFFAQMFGRKGVADTDEGATAPLESYVRYGDVENAYWCKEPGAFCPKSSVMVYGPNFAVALDVVGHEMTHGVITNEADLIYSDEAGAVNEALSDIFGTLIEYEANNGNGNWVIGESLPGFSLTKPLRNLANPHMSDDNGTSLFDPAQGFSAGNRGQPDHYSEYVKREHALCETTNDYFTGCVHFNSGIFNKFAYLIAEGGRQRDVTVNGIGRTKLGRIAYRALTTQMHTNTGLIEAAEAFLQSCRELSNSDKPAVQSTDCEQIEQARSATGLVPPTT